MKTSIRSKRFTLGVVLFLVIILFLSVSSAYYLNWLSGKTNSILRENHYSVVYARDMSEELTKINQAMTNWFLTNQNPDTLAIAGNFIMFTRSFELAKNNITETGEDRLISSIETNYSEYRNSVLSLIKSTNPIIQDFSIQAKFANLYSQLMLLSQMNENAIVTKTEDAKVSAKKATLRMTFIGTLCFLIAYGFTFSFSSYFNDRFYRLYIGIKEMVSGNYRQRIYLGGNDELSEISKAFNELAEKLNTNQQKLSVNLHSDTGKDNSHNEIKELKSLLNQIKTIERQIMELVFGLEKK